MCLRRFLWSLFIGLVAVILSPRHVVDGFNVETKHYAVYRMEERSMFGFAVSTYRDKFARGWAIVGAPEAETAQAGVYRGGAVYKCDIAADDRCNIIHFDDKAYFPNKYCQNSSKQSGSKSSRNANAKAKYTQFRSKLIINSAMAAQLNDC